MCVCGCEFFTQQNPQEKKKNTTARWAPLFCHPKTLTKLSRLSKISKAEKIPANQWRSLDDISMIHGRKQTIYYFLSNCFEPGCLYHSYFEKGSRKPTWLAGKFQQFEDAFPIQQGGFTGSHVENPKHGILSWTPGPEALGDRPPLMKIFFRQAELDTWKVYHPPWN